MATQRVDLKEGMSLEIASAEGDLTIVGSDELSLTIETGKDSYELTQQEEKIILRLSDDARILAWKALPVMLRQLDGDLSVRGLSGPLDISEARGDVTLNDVGDVRLSNGDGDVSISRAGAVHGQGYLDDDVALRHVGAVELLEVNGDLTVNKAASLALERAGGDVSVAGVAGEVRLKEVHGDVTLRDIGGAVEMGRVRGDLSGRDLRGDVQVARVDGDITLSTALQTGCRYNLVCRHDINLRFPADTAAVFIIQARQWTLPRQGEYQVERSEDRAVVRLGQGGPEVLLACDGEVTLGLMSDWEHGVEDLGQHMEAWGEEFGREMAAWGEEMRRQMEEVDWEGISREVGEATARIAHLVETRLEEIDLDEIGRRAEEAARRAEKRAREVDWERIGRKVERAAQHGMARAQAGLQRLQERLQRRGGGAVPPAPPVPPPPPPPPTPPAAAETPSAAETGPAAAAAAPSPAAGLSEEKMAVLALVEEGRLTAEEAAALLDALEE